MHPQGGGRGCNVAEATTDTLGKGKLMTTEGARNASCNLSGKEDRWGAAEFFLLRLFILCLANLLKEKL